MNGLLKVSGERNARLESNMDRRSSPPNCHKLWSFNLLFVCLCIALHQKPTSDCVSSSIFALSIQEFKKNAKEQLKAYSSRFNLNIACFFFVPALLAQHLAVFFCHLPIILSLTLRRIVYATHVEQIYVTLTQLREIYAPHIRQNRHNSRGDMHRERDA